MFDFVRSRNRTAAVFVVSLLVFVPALVVPRSDEDTTPRLLILFASLAAVSISAVWLIVRWNEAKSLIRLRAGEGVLARWTIELTLWARFRERSAEWDKQKDLFPNNADLAQSTGEAGIDIVVTNDGILIGEQFQPLQKNARITVRSDWIEFYQIIPKRDGPPLPVVLRLPLEPGKESLATNVQQSYQLACHAARSSRRPLLYVALLCFVGLPAGTALVWFIAKVTGWI